MAENKAHEDGFLDRPSRDVAVVLLFGPDRGLVSERAQRFLKASGLSLEDAFTVVRLESALIEGEPGRLFDEVATVSMFAPERIVWIQGAGNGKALSDAIKAIAAAPARGVRVLIEAGELKKGAGLRGIVAASAHGVALPCYADDDRAIGRIVDEELGRAGMTIAPQARALLCGALGGDRLASRSEIDKLLLYVHGTKRIEVEDVQAVVGDAAVWSFDEVIDAAFAGRLAETDRLMMRGLGQGSQAGGLIAAALRHLQLLSVLRNRMDGEGVSAASAISSWRPQIFFSRHRDVETALRLLNATSIAAILARLQAAVLDSRRIAPLEGAIVRHCFLGLAQFAEKRREQA